MRYSKLLIFFLLVLPLVSANDINIDDKNWSIGENKIKINFSFVPNSVSFDYPSNFYYKSIKQLDNYTYEAIFETENYGNFTLNITTSIFNKSFEINLKKPIINETIEEKKEEKEENKLCFGFTKGECILGYVSISLILVTISLVVIMVDMARKMTKK